jgi:small subunit ribosomal protein S21
LINVVIAHQNLHWSFSVLKKKMQREGVFREMKQRRSYEKPSQRKTREKAEAIRRARKLARKKAQREGLIDNGRRKKALVGSAQGRRPGMLNRSASPRF